MKELLSDAIDNYAALRGSQDYVKRTLANEKSVLKRLLTVAGNIYVSNIAEHHVIRYFEDAGKTRAPRSLQIDHTVLTQFFDWARKSKRMPADSDPMAHRRRPRYTTKERNRLHVSQFDHLLTIAGERDPRTRIIVAVLLYTLVRDQEAADLRVGDVDLDAGTLTVRITKTKQEDRMPISAEFDAELRSWLTHYTTEAGPLKHYHYLIPRRQPLAIVQSGVSGQIVGHRMVYLPHKGVSRFGKLLLPLLEEIGFPLVDHNGEPTREGSHTIRRSGARALFDRLAGSGYDHSLRIVQSMLHHSTVVRTEQYIGITADRRSRDEILRGKIMYETKADNVVRLTV